MTQIKKLAKKINLIVTDVDGVLTDGGRYYSKDGEILKKFATRTVSAGVDTFFTAVLWTFSVKFDAAGKTNAQNAKNNENCRDLGSFLVREAPRQITTHQ